MGLILLPNKALNKVTFAFMANQQSTCTFTRTVVPLSSAVIKKLENCKDEDKDEDCEFGIVGGLAEFKSDSGNMNKHYAQIFADMVRVGTLLACKALISGRIVDKITVYGLLIDYKTGSAVITKYYVNFITDESIYFVGDEINAVKGLISIVHTVKTMS